VLKFVNRRMFGSESQGLTPPVQVEEFFRVFYQPMTRES
jgi:hypothetical protein